MDTGRQAAAECRARRLVEAADQCDRVDRVDGWEDRARGMVDVVTVPERQGLEAVDILRLRGGCGGVLHDTPALPLPLLSGERAVPGAATGVGVGAGAGIGTGAAGSTLSFLVPFGTAEAWQLPGSSCRHVRVPGPEYDWLLPPGDGLGRAALTDPGQLSEALGEAARTLAVCDGCRS
ncbi:hypothetical protein [Streptacidiphilus sp. MAP5-52]|uniref:hypothetical protein n=1 Tax=Streptacidiphilus sp. MAP5-52 TaxID=3156267 RepID=UPI0035188684